MLRLPPRLAWQPDKWDRLSSTAGFVAGASSVVDVGGRADEMARVLRGTRVVSVNVEAPADVVFAGDRLPFDDGAFEAATSSDVIEHIPAEARVGHVRELVRVSRRRAVLCCPLGTPYQRQAEQELAEWLTAELGRPLEFLEEHLRFGIPSEEELAAIVADAAPQARVTWRFQGDVDAGNRMLRDGVRARWGHDPRALARYLRTAYLRRRDEPLEPQARPTSKRVFVVLDLDGRPNGPATATR